MNQKGYTLIEAILVLTILSVFTSIPILYLLPLYEEKKIEYFFHQLQKDLLFAQQYSISHSINMKVEFLEAESNYKIIKSNNDVLLKREFDSSIQIHYRTLGHTLHITPSGNIQKAGTLKIEYKGQSYILTFLLGRGRFYVTKQ